MATKQKKPPGKHYKFTLRQTVSISDVNFKKQFIKGSTELIILPTTTSRIWKIPLNCKQCRILSVAINSTRKVKFDYIDPTLCICPPDTKKRNLEYFTSCHGDALKSCDLEYGGELIVKVPRDIYDHVASISDKMVVTIEFSLERPKGGIQFVTDPHPHVYSYGNSISTRSWCPCVDMLSELCHWALSFTVPANMVVVCSGELVEQTLSGDGHKKTYHYSVTLPTPAPLMGFAIGPFVVYPDPSISEVTHFCLPGLLPVLKNTVGFVHEVWGFYEELLSSGFPHSSYKLVFVENLHRPVTSYSSLGIYNNDLLHSARINDQVQCTRSVISLSIASQYFQCYMLPKTWNDWWLSVGVSQFISGLLLTKLFGSTEYQYLINQERCRVYDYEVDHTLPPLCDTTGGRTFNPYLSCQRDVEVLALKAHLVMRMVQLKIGEDLLVQVFNKLLTLASAAAQDSSHTQWSNMLLSTNTFLKLVATVSGKDLTHFANQWIYDNGVTAFTGSYSYVRKKNIIELKLIQEPPRGYKKCVSSMMIVVQEYDGCFTHNIQVEENTIIYDIPCHSKIRKAKKRKMPLSHGEEIEIDVSTMDIEVPVLWVKVDADMAWIASMYIQQSDVTLQHIVKYDRDAISQMKAIESLENFPSVESTSILKDFILNNSFYYRARIEAGRVLASMTSSLSTGIDVLVTAYRQLYCIYPSTTLMRTSNFTDVASYFVQKELPVYIAGIRNGQGHCPSDMIQFIVEVIKFNDNKDNQYSDDYLRARLITALSLTVSSAILPQVDVQSPLLLLQQDIQIILKLIVEFLNIEKVLPSYKNIITCSCLEAVRMLQKQGHIPSDTSIFKEYNHVSQYKDVRITAIKAIVDVVHCDHSETDLNYLLDIVEDNNQLLLLRLSVLDALTKDPPFTRRTTSSLNVLPLVERMWNMICNKLPSDILLRNAAVELYNSMYGRLTPSCVPQGLGMVIDLKERVARSSLSTLSTPIVTPKVEVPHVAMTTLLPSTKISPYPETVPFKMPQQMPASLDYGEQYGEGGPRDKKHKTDKKQKKKHKHKHKHKHKEFS